MTVPELVAALEAMGCQIRGGSRPSISQPVKVEHRKRFQELYQWLSLYRLEVLAHYEPPAARTLCPLCGRDVTDTEDRERLAGINPFCVLAPQGKGWDRLKEKVIPEKPGCPYRTE